MSCKKTKSSWRCHTQGGLLALLLVVLGWSASAQSEDTLAVWDFDNNTVGPLAGIQAVEHLRRVLPEALLARLTQMPGLRVVERVRLREILEEQKLASGDIADADTRLRLGRILGARGMLFGDYVALGPMIRVDVRLVDVTTSRILLAEPVIGVQAEVLAGMNAVADKVAQGYGQQLAPDGAVGVVSPEIWAAYDAGLRQMDEKRYDLAIETFKRVLTLNPRFAPAERQIALALERLARGP